MREIERRVIPAEMVRSLVWWEDTLCDPVAGWRRFGLDGRSGNDRRYGNMSYSYPFDRAALSPDGRYAVLYTVLGTKGLVLHDGQVLREINRSYYHAHVFEYPVAIFRAPDGRQLLAHCPDEYNVLQLEELDSGRRLTARESAPADFFHSRLQASPDGRYLLSAGWVWQPMEALMMHSVEEALRRPESLDDERGLLDYSGISDVGDEVEAAAFAPDGTVLLGISDVSKTGPALLGHYDIEDARWLSLVTLAEHLGTMMPMEDYIVGFYGHPKLVHIATGEVVARWPELSTGDQIGSIHWHTDKLPPLALDPAHRRFAVSGERAITVVQLG